MPYSPKWKKTQNLPWSHSKTFVTAKLKSDTSKPSIILTLGVSNIDHKGLGCCQLLVISSHRPVQYSYKTNKGLSSHLQWAVSPSRARRAQFINFSGNVVQHKVATVHQALDSEPVRGSSIETIMSLKPCQGKCTEYKQI